MAAGGLRRPPTKSPNRIPFGFRASPRRVNNVFTRRFGSFAVGTPLPCSVHPLRAPWLHVAPIAREPTCERVCGCARVCVFPSYFFLVSCSPSSSGSMRRMRSACCTFRGCLQLRIMNIDNTGGPGGTGDRSNVNISAISRGLATRAMREPDVPFAPASSLAASRFALLPFSQADDARCSHTTLAGLDPSTLPTRPFGNSPRLSLFYKSVSDVVLSSVPCLCLLLSFSPSFFFLSFNVSDVRAHADRRMFDTRARI